MRSLFLSLLLAGCCIPAETYTTEIGSAVIGGTASWYDGHKDEAAAGPALREILGQDWKGTVVEVCLREACTTVQLTGVCQCERLIDLDRANFSNLADPVLSELVEVIIELP